MIHKKYQDHIPCSFAYKAVCIDNIFSKKVVLYRGKNAIYRFIEASLKEYDNCKKIIKNHFNKILIMCQEEEEKFQLRNNCLICNKLFGVINFKVRDHCHITENIEVLHTGVVISVLNGLRKFL